MRKQFFGDAEVVNPNELTGVQRAFDTLSNVREAFGQDIYGLLLEQVESLPVFDLQLSVNGIATIFHTLDRRGDGVIVGMLKGGHAIVVEQEHILDANGAALEAGLGDIRTLEVRYSHDDDPDGMKWMEDFDSFLK